jgi:uncharacterized repeat protein (TIGR02543 family)
MKKTVFLGLLVILLAFGFINCAHGSDRTTTYTVTFDSNGGSDVAKITGILSRTTITLPANPTKSDNDFIGWFFDDGTFSSEFTSLTPVTKNLTVYARWGIPSLFHGTWEWVRPDWTGHTITMIIGSSTITTVVVNDTDDSKNGSTTFSVTNVAESGTYFDGEDWTKYTNTVTGMGNITYGLNQAKNKIQDRNGLPVDDFPRVFIKKD